MSEPQSQAKAHQCRIFDAASIRKDSAAIGKDTGMGIHAKLYPTPDMVSPLRQIFKLTATAPEHVGRHRDLVDR